MSYESYVRGLDSVFLCLLDLSQVDLCGFTNVAVGCGRVSVLSDGLLEWLELGTYLLLFLFVVLTIFLQIFELLLLRENLG